MEAIARDLSRGHHVLIFAPSHAGNSSGPVNEALSLSRVYRPRSKGKKRWLEYPYFKNKILRAFIQVLKSFQPDIVHMHNLRSLPLAVIKVCKVAGVPMVATLHDFWFACPLSHLTGDLGEPCGERAAANPCASCVSRQYLSGNLSKVFDPWNVLFCKARYQCSQALLRQMSRIISPSEYLKKVFHNFGFATADWVCLPHGIDTALLSPVEKIPSARLRIGYVGAIQRYKGVHVLVEAFQRLKLRDIELRIFGDPCGHDSYLDRILRSIQGDERIAYWGPFRHDAIREVFAQIDLLVLPTLCPENYPLTVLESLASLTPVLASDRGGTTEMIRHDVDSLLFDSHSTKDLASKLGGVISRREKINELRDHIKPVKPVSEYVPELLKIYQACRG